MRENEGAKEKV